MGYKLYKGLRSSETDKSTVRGSPRRGPLDLNNSDVEDAQFEEIDTKKRVKVVLYDDGDERGSGGDTKLQEIEAEVKIS